MAVIVGKSAFVVWSTFITPYSLYIIFTNHTEPHGIKASFLALYLANDKTQAYL